MPFPTVATHLPDLRPFIDALAHDYASGAFDGWPAFAARVHAYYTPARMDQFERILPGWQQMASYRDGITLIHITAALAALFLLPEYRQANPADQELMQWIILFHDLTKRIIPGTKDHTHAFRSAAVAGRQLPQLGFPVNGDVASWAAFTLAATIPHADHGEPIHDNRQLPEILAGIDQLFGPNTPAALIIKTVLLHMSISNLHDWPQAAPFTASDIQQYIEPSILPLLKIMMLVDNDAWTLFDPAVKLGYRIETLEIFEHVALLVGV